MEQIIKTYFSPLKPGAPDQLQSVSPVKGKKADSGTVNASSKPTSEKGNDRKKQKEATPDAKKTLELLDLDTTEEENEEEEEEEKEPERPLIDRKRSMVTRSSE